jgi:hypothetical protein
MVPGGMAAEGTTTRLVMVTGEALLVDGTVDDIGRLLQDAARSTSGALAWLETSGGEKLGVNPAHVVTVSAGD